MNPTNLSEPSSGHDDRMREVDQRKLFRILGNFSGNFPAKHLPPEVQLLREVAVLRVGDDSQHLKQEILKSPWGGNRDLSFLQ